MINGITLILLSLLAVPSLILSKRPDATEILAKVAPYQGWIGLTFSFWGVWGLISAILNITLLTSNPIWWGTWVASSLIETILGFMLGYALINKYLLSKSEDSMKKGQYMLAKLAPIQGTLGIVGLGVGVWTIVASFLFFG